MRGENPRWHTQQKQERRKNKTGVREQVTANLAADAATAYAKLIEAPDEETSQRLRQAVLDAMCGIRTERQYRRPRLQAGEREEEWENQDGETVWVYVSPPDIKLMTLVLEQQLGKPALRPHEAVDPDIRIMTCVPGYSLDPALEGRGGAPAGFALPADEEGAGGADPETLAKAAVGELLASPDGWDDEDLEVEA